MQYTTPTTDAKLIAVYRYNLPLFQPLVLANGTHSKRCGLLLKFVSSQGVHWGEAAPLPGFSRESLLQVEAELMMYLRGSAPIESLPASLQFAISMGQTPLPAISRNIKSAQLITTDQNLTTLSSQVIKLKVGPEALVEEIKRVKALLAHPSHPTLRLDANRQFDLTTALTFAKAIGFQPQIEFIEEPCQTLAQTQAFAAQSGWPVALDETLQPPDYQAELFDGLAALVCKPTLTGSLQRCQQLALFAQASKLQFILSGSFESNQTHHYLNQLAQRWAPESYHGLDTIRNIAADLITSRSPESTIKVIDEQELEPIWRA